MNTALMFSSASDEWSTPQDLFDQLHAEFTFEVDLAASAANAKCARWWSLADNALAQSWHDQYARGFCNPPYSRGRQAAFIAKAAHERQQGFLTVMLIPARTDTKAFHRYLYDATTWRVRPGIEIRFLPGRLKFGTSVNSAPFPSMVVVFRPDPPTLPGA